MVVEDIKITGLMFNYYFICKKKIWYFYHHISMEQNNEDVHLGKIIDENTYKRNKKHILIDGIINIDFINGNRIVHEVKKSRAMSIASSWQLKYYLYYLKNKGVNDITGLIDYPILKKRERIKLTKKDIIEIQKILKEIKKIINYKFPPDVKKISICKKCSYYELCYI